MNKTIKQYYNLAFDYHISALILWTQLINTPNIYNPTIYLLRHTTELLLKCLIIKENLNVDKNIEINSIKLSNNYKLNNTHSLMELWEYFKSIHRQATLTPLFDREQEKTIDKTIKFFNDRDPYSVNFRYPYNKNGKPIIIEPITLDSEIAPDLGKKIPYIIEYGSQKCYIKKGKTYLDKTLGLFETVELLFQWVEN